MKLFLKNLAGIGLITSIALKALSRNHAMLKLATTTKMKRS